MRALTLLVAAAAALVLSAPAAAATTPATGTGDPFPFPCFFAPSPGSGWVPVARGYSTCERCETAGEAGVDRGDWEQYHCAFVPIGLDGSYWLFVPETAQRAAAAPDPYLDGLAPSNGIPVDDAADLTGARDGRFATVHGRQFTFLVLDFGAGEEVLGDVEVHYELRPQEMFGISMDVHFLDRDGRSLGQSLLGMAAWDADRTTVIKSPTTKPYRYLKILTTLDTVYIDAMRAAALAP